MACGLPVLCSRFNGCYPELIEEGANGWVFDPLSPGDTHRVLQLAVQDSSNLAAMGRRSSEIVASFTPENAATAIMDACKMAGTASEGRSRRPARTQ